MSHGTNKLQKSSPSPIILSPNSVGSITSGSSWHTGSLTGFGISETNGSESSEKHFRLVEFAPIFPILYLFDMRWTFFSLEIFYLIEPGPFS